MGLIKPVSLLRGGSDEQGLPLHIYKYRRWDDSNHQRLLTHNELYFASARDFNDPFDSSVFFDYQSRSDSELLSITRGQVEKRNPDLLPKEIDARAQYEFERSPVRDETRRVRIRESQLEGIYRKYGICTFSARYDHILMWSHYAKSHTGFCVGLNVLKLLAFLESHFERTGELIDPLEVVYADNYPSYNPLEVEGDNYLPLILATKSAHWQYEREHRLVLIDHIKPVVIDDGIIDQIIMGCRMLPQDRTDLMCKLRSSNFKGELLTATVKEREFGLDFHSVEYQY